MDKVNPMSVLDYLNNLLCNQILKNTTNYLPENKIDMKIKKFALKLLNCEQISNAKSFDWNDVNNKLYSNEFPVYRQNIHENDGKMYFDYSNADVLEFLNYLRQLNYSPENFDLFFRTPHVYNMFVNLYYSNIFFYEFINVKGVPITRKNIIRILDILGIFRKYKEQWYLLFDSALVFYGLRSEVGFLQLAVTPNLLSKIKNDFNVVCSGEKYWVGNIIEIIVINKENFSSEEKDMIFLEKVEDILAQKENLLNNCNEHYERKRLTIEVNKIKEYLQK